MIAIATLALSLAIAADTTGNRLETGCGGGITGGGGGVAVFSDGSFYRWSSDRPATAGRELSLVRVDTARANALFREATKEGLATTHYSEPSNVTCSVSIRIDGVENEVAWSASTRPRRIAKLIDLARHINDSFADSSGRSARARSPSHRGVPSR
jgi:hypothetical protein